MTGITAFDNFYESLRWSNPGMHRLMHDDLKAVTLGGLTGKREAQYEAVVRLRQRALSLPTGMAKILDHILTVDLGYSLDHVAQVQQTNLALNNARASRRIHGL